MARRDKARKYLEPRSTRWRLRAPGPFFLGKRIELILRLLKKLRAGTEIRRHFGVSRAEYETYDDWEMRIEEAGAIWTLDHDRMDLVPFRTIRAYYLAPVVAEIEMLHAALGRPVEVLEVGCGNGTNLKVLSERLGPKVVLRGIDISPQRLQQGRAYWGDALDGIEMAEDSATTLATVPDTSVDLVYSVHCLEQIPYAVDACLAAMARVTRSRAVFVEPVWEFANPTQKLYTLFGDQLRTLLPALAQSPLKVERSWQAKLISNPLNQTGFVIAGKS
jgi:ubiquinone/menaquinone biosynthesis C-methylase UbiE